MRVGCCCIGRGSCRHSCLQCTAIAWTLLSVSICLTLKPLCSYHILVLSFSLLLLSDCAICSNLANKGLAGSLPAETSLWGGLTGLTTLDLAGNSLGGPVPIQLTAAGPQLASM
jgi:hypothetical protein